MFKNAYQSGLLSIFYSCGANPLAIWDMEVKNGHIKRITDTEVNSIVLEIVSTNVATTYVSCPRNNQTLGIKLPFLVMIVKNLKRYFSFEITILDDKNMRRRFRISNFQSTTKIKPFCTSMPIGLSGGWNQIQFNLADFTKRAYGSQFIETLRVQVHANVRLRRIYFAERLYTEEELPQDYKLFLPLEKKVKKVKKEPSVKAVVPAPPTPAEAVPEEAAAPAEGAIEEKAADEATPETVEGAEVAGEEGKEVAGEEAGAEGEAAEGEAPQGAAPEGEAPEGEAPEGEAPEGEATEGAAPEGEAPEGEVETAAAGEEPPAEDVAGEAAETGEAPEAPPVEEPAEAEPEG